MDTLTSNYFGSYTKVKGSDCVEDNKAAGNYLLLKTFLKMLWTQNNLLGW